MLKRDFIKQAAAVAAVGAASAEAGATAALPPSESELNLFVTFKSLPEKRQEVAGMLGQARAGLSEVPGCLGARLFADANGEPVFTLLERWTSQQAHREHIAKVVQTSGWNALKSLLEIEPTSRYFLEHR
jgi:quinol monooxygenase YgiN